MNSDRVTILMAIALVVAVLLTYGRFTHMEQLMTRQRIDGLNLRLESLIGTIRESDSRYRSYSEELRGLQDKIALIEGEKTELWSKLDSMSRDLDGLRTNVLAASADTNKKMVELGAISVKKHEKARK